MTGKSLLEETDHRAALCELTLVRTRKTLCGDASVRSVAVPQLCEAAALTAELSAVRGGHLGLFPFRAAPLVSPFTKDTRFARCPHLLLMRPNVLISSSEKTVTIYLFVTNVLTDYSFIYVFVHFFFLLHPESATRHTSKDGLKRTLGNWIRKRQPSSRDGACLERQAGCRLFSAEANYAIYVVSMERRGALDGRWCSARNKNLCSEPPAGTSDKHLI